MHTVKLIGAGLLALAVVIGIGRVLAGDAGMARAVTWFFPLWLVAALANMYVGVRVAGYSVTSEVPFFLLVFGVPAIAAFVLRRFLLS